MDWSATQYKKFEAERTRPVRDLLAHIPNAEAANAADLGCGPGNSTELLQARYPQADILAIDSSPDMIAAAQQRLPNITFEIADIAHWQPKKPTFDIILANASLQWLPDHASLLSSLLSKLIPGGTLAVQIPDNFKEPAHQLMREIATQGAWSKKLKEAPRALDTRHTPGWYYRILSEHGASVNIWRTIYYHPLAGGASAIVEWFKATGLRPFLLPLNNEEQTEFLNRYQTAIAQAYPSLPDGTVLLPFPRLFFIATC